MPISNTCNVARKRDMVDTLHLYKILSKAELKLVLMKLRGRRKIDMDTGEVTIYGSLPGGMIVILKGDRLYIRGSLSQFFLGNYESLKWHQLAPALQKLEEQLSISIQDAVIKRIDIEGTFHLTDCIHTYFDILGTPPRYLRFISGNSLYMKTGNRTLIFYNKGKAIRYKSHGAIDAPDTLSRFEMRYRDGYLRQWVQKRGMDNLHAGDLMNTEIQLELMRSWIKEYEAIPKQSRMTFNSDHVKSVAELKNLIFQQGIESLGGREEVIRMLKQSLSDGKEVDRRVKSKMLDCVRSVPTMVKNFIVEDERIGELNRALGQIFNSNLSQLTSN